MAERTLLDSRARNLTGLKFGKLTVVRPTARRLGEFVIWECLCECGRTIEASSARLRPGRTWHCGCTKAKRAQRQDREYRIWCDMRNRCNNPNNKRYHRYGARGINICERWNVFANFLSDMGKCPVGMTIDRINNDSNYEPANCKWSTYHEQHTNMSRNRMLTLNGETMCLADWGRRLGMDGDRIGARIDADGWSIERALTTPLRALKTRKPR